MVAVSWSASGKMPFKTLFNGRNAVRIEKSHKLMTPTKRSPPLIYYFLLIFPDNEMIQIQALIQLYPNAQARLMVKRFPN
ncbi:hypothetical protein PI95_017170 [Hassallia byssoidea VB512170]|uniref:Uncharacterized protein n=1 Tax=Hassallia byssoidea VB512170 TaxID=1304833 RepID=A0A846HB05_9CYAN|nr:hypothetical protein [Hassalia byssoidea]NEU74243.1 hypothetical protein [Hassalia byssoidea VB512170]